MSGGVRATYQPSPDPRPPLTPGRNGGDAQEGVRDATRRHGPYLDDPLDSIAEEGSGVKAGGSHLSRRNSVASCSLATQNRGGMAMLRVPWSRAATEKEFISLMERVQEECAPPITANRPSRKSLPAGALRSYMRSTASSVRRSHGSGGSPSPSPQDESSKVKRDSQVSKTQSLLPRKKIVPVKPSIPPVLLKDRGSVGGSAASVGDEARHPVPSSTNKDSPQQHPPGDSTSVAAGGKEGLLKKGVGGATGPCETNCKGCQLVDLWFIFWHAQFNPPSVHKPEKNKATLPAM